ncbi:cupin domain-containing protein [Pseudomonas silvicola]|nr:cupin domain-containing protein [Pseudomonas silvicola]
MNKMYCQTALLAASLLIATQGFAAEPSLSAQAMQKNKTVVMETEYPAGHVTRIVKTVVPADAQAPLHEHPGIESGYILRGGGTLYVQGQPDRELKPGEAALVPPYTAHWFKNGHQETVILSTYVLESGKDPMTLIKP